MNVSLRLLALLSLAVGCAGATADPDAAIDRDAAADHDAAPARDATMLGDAAAIDAAVLSDGGSDAGCATLDCSNAACAHASCETVPTDWTGPFALYDGPAATAPTCGSGATIYSGHAGLTAAPATCAACTCEPPTGGACHLPQLSVTDAACASSTPTCLAELAIPDPWTGVCEGPDGLSGGRTTCGASADPTCATGHSACNVSAQMGPTTVTGASCVAQGGAASTPAVAWDRVGLACTLPAGTGCATGTCVGAPATPFLATACIQHAGEMACPAGAFSESHVFYADVTDTRACTACGCGVATNVSCAATVRVFSAAALATCTGPIATLSLDSTAGACVNLTGNPTVGSRSATIAAPSGGTCPSSGGEATGDATPANATTFCCLPST